MKITVVAHPRSKFEKVIEHEGVYNCYFNVAPAGGRANTKIIEMLSDHFNVSKTNICIIIGKTAKEKVVEIKGVSE
jgi:uncharacterized protein YggU (UPF0235/DUF167 family)